MSIENFIENCNFIKPIFINIDSIDFKINECLVAEYINVLSGDTFDFLYMSHEKKFEDILKKTEYVRLNKFVYNDNDASVNEILNILPGLWMLRHNYNGDFLLENVSFRESLINNNGSWNIKNLNEHVFDDFLAKALINYFKIEEINSCVDFGCGPGKYVEYFNANGLKTIGYDGNPYTKEMTNGICDIIDLSIPFKLKKKFDCVLSLEVGEHIPKKFQEIFINNLIEHTNKLIIISWAIPGQSGYGHINNQTNEYIRNIFIKKGFKEQIYMDNIIRLTAYNTWFKNTIMIFKK